MLGIKVEDPAGFDQADLAMATPGVTFGEWGPGDMGLFLDHPEWKEAPFSPEMDNAWQIVKRACDKAGINWLCMWDDPDLSTAEKAAHLINNIGATLIAGVDGEELASAGRKLTKRQMPV
jgi:2-keto-3-deoxy-L-rhamnonate aldolase RhmA